MAKGADNCDCGVYAYGQQPMRYPRLDWFQFSQLPCESGSAVVFLTLNLEGTSAQLHVLQLVLSNSGPCSSTYSGLHIT